MHPDNYCAIARGMVQHLGMGEKVRIYEDGATDQLRFCWIGGPDYVELALDRVELVDAQFPEALIRGTITQLLLRAEHPHRGRRPERVFVDELTLGNVPDATITNARLSPYVSFFTGSLSALNPRATLPYNDLSADIANHPDYVSHTATPIAIAEQQRQAEQYRLLHGDLLNRGLTAQPAQPLRRMDTVPIYNAPNDDALNAFTYSVGAMDPQKVHSWTSTFVDTPLAPPEPDPVLVWVCHACGTTIESTDEPDTCPHPDCPRPHAGFGIDATSTTQGGTTE